MPAFVTYSSVIHVWFFDHPVLAMHVLIQFEDYLETPHFGEGFAPCC